MTQEEAITKLFSEVVVESFLNLESTWRFSSAVVGRSMSKCHIGVDEIDVVLLSWSGGINLGRGETLPCLQVYKVLCV